MALSTARVLSTISRVMLATRSSVLTKYSEMELKMRKISDSMRRFCWLTSYRRCFSWLRKGCPLSLASLSRSSSSFLPLGVFACIINLLARLLITMLRYLQMQHSSMFVPALALVAVQLALFCLLLVVGLLRTCMASRLGWPYVVRVLAIACAYIVVELGIQGLQLANVLLTREPEQICNIVIALNIFCVLLDQAVVLMLGTCWARMRDSFQGPIAFDQPNAPGVFYRLLPSICIALAYGGYLIYLVASGYLTDKVEGMETSRGNMIGLYVVAQGVSGLALLVCISWQARGWCQLESTLISVEGFYPIGKNKLRMRTFFWTTFSVNLLRTLFICYIIVAAYEQQYRQLIIALNLYTLTATGPILFYLFGFRLKRQENEELVERRESQSSDRKTSSHETELSVRSKH